MEKTIKIRFKKIMTAIMLVLGALQFSAFDAFAYQYTLEGTVGGKYPIVAEVDKNAAIASMMALEIQKARAA